MFENFTQERIHGEGAEIFVRHGADPSKPGLLFLHGYPQTSAMWRHVAPAFLDEYHVVCADLRGYGRSEKPQSDPLHLTYSKRTMAADMVAVMKSLGHEDFTIASHDRGSRVAHRLGLDHAERVKAITILDIAPTREMYANTTFEFAKAYAHWFYLIQDAPFPEHFISRDSDTFWKLKCMGGKDTSPIFDGEALEEYLAAFRDPACIHATCEDYRAAASIDIAHDDADEGAKLQMPILVLWGKDGTIEKCFDAMSLWRERAQSVKGQAIPGGHYLAEQHSENVIAHFREFFASLRTPGTIIS